VEEQYRRRVIRKSLTEWAINCGYEPAAHHKLLIAELEALARNDTDRLMVVMPPGSAKSTYTSVLFPPWLMQSVSGSAILAASHTVQLAERFGRRARNLVATQSAVLKMALVGDNKAAGRWAVDNGAEYYAAGVDTGIAGFRADIALIDDPIRSHLDAASEVKRESVWQWYKMDLMPRMRPGGRIALIQTRWNEDDLAGRILNEKGSSRWRLLHIPAECDSANDPLGRNQGEMLWDDDDYGYADVLKREKATQLPAVWSALYQGRPSPPTGTYFEEGWLRPIRKLPALDTLTCYGGADFAVTEGKGDYTAIVIVGFDPQNRLYLLDVWRQQASADRWVRQVTSMVKKYKPLDFATELGQIDSGVGPFLEQRMMAERAWVKIHKFPTRGEKAIRARSMQGRMAMDGLYVDMNAPYYAALRSELLAFPNGKHDDQVDALGLVGQLLDIVAPGRKPTTAEGKGKFSDYARHDEPDQRGFDKAF